MNLDAVARALLADAEADAAAELADADRDAAATLEAARAEADRLLAAARQAGEAEARAVAAAELARARRRAREAVLAARRRVWEDARVAGRRAAASLRDGPRYDDLLAGLRAAARAQLGDAAAVDVDAEAGGVVASAGTASVDYRLPAVADRCFAAVGSGVDDLWA